MVNVNKNINNLNTWIAWLSREWYKEGVEVMVDIFATIHRATAWSTTVVLQKKVGKVGCGGCLTVERSRS